MPLQCFPYICTGKPGICNLLCLRITGVGGGSTHMYVMTFTRFAQKLLHRCMLALCGSHCSLVPWLLYSIYTTLKIKLEVTFLVVGPDFESSNALRMTSTTSRNVGKWVPSLSRSKRNSASILY